MYQCSDVLLMLCSYSLQATQYEKAAIYAEVGMQTNNNDIRFIEFYGEALLHLERITELSALLQKTDIKTRNILYLKVRLGLIEREDPDIIKKNLIEYFKYT